MALLEFPMHLLTAALMGYLALTNQLADGIEPLLGIERPPLAVSEESIISQQTPEGTAFRQPPEYEYGGPIPKILIDNAAYQIAATNTAAVAGASTTAEADVSLRIKHALVNIFCQYRTDTYVRTTTGTGFFIDPKGAVLTNAHIAQFLLLKDASSIRESGCILRIGDPAQAAFTADLLYISPAWIHKNAELITIEKPKGTGERDYAILYVSGAIGEMILPDSFPSLPVDTALLPKSTEGKMVLTAGYPAEIIFTEGAKAELRPRVDQAHVGELYTFGSNYADIFSVSTSSVGEHGASGGPIVTEDGSVIGLIATKGSDVYEGAGSLRAITLSYVDRTIQEETGFSLEETLSGDLAFRSSVFKKALAPFLERLLTLHMDR